MTFKMRGFSGFGNSPMKKDIKMYEGSGKQIMLDDSVLGKEYLDTMIKEFGGKK